MRRSRTRTATLALGASVVALSLALSSCGGSDDEGKVKDAYNAQWAALAKGKFDQFCNGLTAASQQQVAQVGQATDCTGGINALLDTLSEKERSAIGDIKAQKVEIDGSNAYVQASVDKSLRPLGFTGKSHLVKANGSWLLDVTKTTR